MSEADVKLFAKAAFFSAQKHGDQRRKGANETPYVNHPLSVANILSNEAGITDIVTLCAGVLHDTLEDTDTNYGELVREFGVEIASVVLELTDDKSLEKSVRKQLQIDNIAKKSCAARLVKVADKISNLRDLIASPPTDWDDKRCHAYCDWAKLVIEQIRGVNPSLEAIFDQTFEHATFSR